MPEMQIKISVIICSRDRGPSLRDTLDSLFTPKNLLASDWECILVYYPPDRETEETANEYARKFPSRLRPVGQEGAGKSKALNDGIRAARGGILSFTDDDCLCDDGYLEGIRDVFGDSGIHAVQGRELVEFEGQPPTWFGSLLTVAMGLMEHGNEFREHPKPELYGSNMALRRQVFIEMGGFRPDLGAGTAEPGGMAEDTEFGYRLLKAGYRIFYAPQILIRHRIPAHRLTRSFCFDRFYRCGVSVAHYKPLWNTSIPLWRLGIYHVKEALLAGGRGLYLHWAGRPDEAMEVVLPALGDMGFYLEHVRMRWRGIKGFPIPTVLNKSGPPLLTGSER